MTTGGEKKLPSRRLQTSVAAPFSRPWVPRVSARPCPGRPPRPNKCGHRQLRAPRPHRLGVARLRRLSEHPQGSRRQPHQTWDRRLRRSVASATRRDHRVHGELRAAALSSRHRAAHPWRRESARARHQGNARRHGGQRRVRRQAPGSAAGLLRSRARPCRAPSRGQLHLHRMDRGDQSTGRAHRPTSGCRGTAHQMGRGVPELVWIRRGHR